VWVFTALVLDAFAASAQSLVGYFLGARRADQARRVAAVACQWSVATGVVLAVAMLSLSQVAANGLVPLAAHGVFFGSWWLAAVSQPLNAVSFATDGIHWGTKDFKFLRNAMVVSTALGMVGLWAVDSGGDGTGALARIWWVTAAWILVRGVLGLVRVWPGFGRAPLGRGGT
jgi:MATE family multidrug resistance protein